MGRSAKPGRKKPAPAPGLLQGGAAALGASISRNPVLVGGSTAFLVALFYVSANALWYQPHAHLDAFFATRDFSRASDSGQVEAETTIRIERPQETQPVRDPQTEQVQGILKELGLYAGAVDGIAGPNTTRAIEAYQTKFGLTVSGRIDAALLERLGTTPTTAAIGPTPAPRDDLAGTPEAAGDADRLIVKIQAGLKAFGNEGMEIDGVMGSRTKAALREFQSLFGLPETGEPDETVYAKMKEIGLTN